LDYIWKYRSMFTESRSKFKKKTVCHVDLGNVDHVVKVKFQLFGPVSHTIFYKELILVAILVKLIYIKLHNY
jgi:hypothetical protein